MPATLKEKDRVQFRVHAGDTRHLEKGASQGNGVILPKEDLLPQLTTAPAVFNGEGAWITLRIDLTIEGYLKQQVKAQADELRDIILKIKKKVQSEIDEVQQLQRTIHLQSALTTSQSRCCKPFISAWHPMSKLGDTSPSSSNCRSDRRPVFPKCVTRATFWLASKSKAYAPRG